MFKILKYDLSVFRQELRGQDAVFYLGIFFIVLYYLRPQYIYPQLSIIPWMQLTLLLGFLLMLGRNQLKFTVVHFWVFGFALLAWLSAQASLYPEISSKDISTPFIFSVEVLFLSNCIRNTQQLKLFLIVYFLCIFKMSFFGARTWVSRGFGFADWGISGPAGFFENSGEFSLLMAMAAVIAIPFIVALKPKTKLYYILPLTAIMTVIGASSRGSQLALLVGLVFLLIKYQKISVKNVIYIVAIVSIIWTVLPEQQKQRFESAGDDDTSVTRLAYWTAGIDMAKKHPWLGVGYQAFPEHYHYYYKESREGYLNSRKEASHNSLVQVASSLGLPALVLYLLLHIIVLKPLKFNQHSDQDDSIKDITFLKQLKISLNAALLTYFVGAFFMSVAFYPYIYFLLSLYLICSRLSQQIPEKLKREGRNTPQKTYSNLV